MTTIEYIHYYFTYIRPFVIIAQCSSVISLYHKAERPIPKELYLFCVSIIVWTILNIPLKLYMEIYGNPVYTVFEKICTYGLNTLNMFIIACWTVYALKGKEKVYSEVYIFSGIICLLIVTMTLYFDIKFVTRV